MIEERTKIGLNIFNYSSEKNLDANESEEHEESPAEDTTNSTKNSKSQTPEVVVEELNVRPCKRSKVSEAQTICLQMQEKHHTMEMEILQLKKNNLIEKHQKRMEVLEAELEYWTSVKKRSNTSEANSQAEPTKRMTRQRK